MKNRFRKSIFYPGNRSISCWHFEFIGPVELVSLLVRRIRNVNHMLFNLVYPIILKVFNTDISGGKYVPFVSLSSPQVPKTCFMTPRYPWEFLRGWKGQNHIYSNTKRLCLQCVAITRWESEAGRNWWHLSKNQSPDSNLY